MTTPQYSDLRWEDLPPRRQTKWKEVAEQLQDRPGKWAMVRVLPTAAEAIHLAYRIRRGLVTAMSQGQFEAEARMVEGEHRVYARYVGGSK